MTGKAVGARCATGATALALAFSVAPAAAEATAAEATPAEPEPASRAPHLVAGEEPGTMHLRLDTSALYGIGGQSFLGALVRGALGVTAWDEPSVTGSFDFGLAFAYHNEPTWLAPWLSHGHVEGAGHRAQLFLVAGHTIHLLESRAISLGLHAHAGWNRWISSYSLEYPNEGVRGEATIERDYFIVGGQLTAAARLADHVGLNIVLGGPIPTESAYVIGMFHVGLGLSFFVY